MGLLLAIGVDLFVTALVVALRATPRDPPPRWMLEQDRINRRLWHARQRR